MRTVVAAEVLQLLGVGVADVDDYPDLTDEDRDRYLRPGNYLRWLPSPTLGFPRRGFVLRRRPSPKWPWVKRGDMAEASVDAARRQGAALWLPAVGFGDVAERGVRLSRPGQALSAGNDAVPIDGPGLMVEPRLVEHAPRLDPASWVALRVRAKPHVTVSATAWASGGSLGDDTVMSEASGKISDLDPWDFRQPAGDRVLIVHGGLVDAVELHADEVASLVGVTWLVTELYAVDGSSNSSQTGWEDVGRFLLPIDGDGTDYPSQPDADGVAEQRLHAAAPRARPPWDDPEWPPSDVSQDDAFADLAQRFLGDRLQQMRSLLRAVLEDEVAEQRPQGLVMVDPSISGDVDAVDGAVAYDITNPDGSPSDLDDTASAELPAVPLMLTASMEAGMAHLLGLATVDTEARGNGPYDYAISAVYPNLWWAWLLAPHMADVLERYSEMLQQLAAQGNEPAVVPTLPPDPVDDNEPFFRAVSVATLVMPGAVAPVQPPDDVGVTAVPVAGLSPVAAHGVVTWSTEPQAAFDPAPVVGASVSRHDELGHESLARLDPVHGLPMPYLGGAGLHLLRDNSLRAEGDTDWIVQNLDLWGRWSAPGKATTEIDTHVPPPPPSGVTAVLHGAIDDDNGTVEKIVVAFDWGAGQQQMAPDLQRFDIKLAAGDVAEDEWDDIDGSQGAAEVDPDGSAVSPAGNVKATPLDDGGVRIEVTLGDAQVAENGYRREATAVVRAVDSEGERSAPAGALAEIVDAAPPAPPQGLDEVQFTSWPDADGLGWWTCRWTAQPQTRVQVLRASASRLLAAAGKTRSDMQAEGGLDEQGRFLRDLAAEVYADGDDIGPGSQVGGPKHAHAFSPDHPKSYDDAADRHAIAVDGSSHDLTVLVAMPTGPTGTRADWPDDAGAFTVVAARRLDALAPPRVVARAAGDGNVTLDIEASGGAYRVRLWRTSDPARADDVRAMRPLAPEVLSSGAAALVDGPLVADVWYAYRAVVESEDRRRSAVTEPLWVQVR